jgi:mono/diheme cytochrome c family protein
MRRLITVTVGLLCLALGHAAAQSDADPSEVERFADGDAARGAPLYKRYCAGWHGPDGRGGAPTLMPHVEALTKRGLVHSRRIFV